MAESRYFTNEGLNKLKDELNNLMSVERKKISQQIAEARDKGDLSENAEYDAAKDAQGMLEMKISKLQDIVNNAKIIDESKLDASKVLILSTVEVKNKTNGAKMKYTLVPENEANLKEGKISVTSPIAQGLLGKKVGELATIKVPAGSVTLEIVNISRL
jgi:transcription elongation factor GreA